MDESTERPTMAQLAFRAGINIGRMDGAIRMSLAISGGLLAPGITSWGIALGEIIFHQKWTFISIAIKVGVGIGCWIGSFMAWRSAEREKMKRNEMHAVIEDLLSDSLVSGPQH